MLEIEKLRTIRRLMEPNAAEENRNQRTAQLVIGIIDSHIEALYEVERLRSDVKFLETQLFHERSGGSGDIEPW